MTARTETVLLTGATGYVGKHVLLGLLRAGYRVAVLVRGGRNGDPRSRVQQALLTLGRDDPGGVEIIEADLFQPRCGVNEQALERLRQAGVRAVVHCAGLTRFDAHLAEDIFRSNLQGTQNAFALGQALDAGSFLHVSTAFVAGDARQSYSENDLDIGQGFNNPYERSKFEAEQFLHREAERSGASRIRIYRPSIVVGGHPLGENQHVSTVYTFVKALRFLKACCERDLQRGRGRFLSQGVREEHGRLVIPLRIAAEGGTRVNLVSVQQIVDDILQDLETGIAPLSTRHQLGADFEVAELQQLITESQGIEGVRLVRAQAFEQQPRTAIEQFFNRTTREYQPYLLAGRCFPDAEKSDRHPLDMPCIIREFDALLEESSDRSTASESTGQTLKHLALNALGVSGPHDYFSRLVNGQMGASLMRRIAYVQAAIRFVIRGERTYDRVLRIDHGSIRYVEEAAPAFDFSYELAQPLFEDIIHGRTDLRKAFFQGKVRIRGNKEAALKFGFLFGDYLQRADEHVIEEVVGL